MTQIFQEVQAGNVDAVAQQLEQGVAVDIRDASDRTPLMVAVTCPDAGVEYAGVEMVHLLLEHGADANAVENQENRTVLALAVQQGTAAQVQLLLEAGANIRYQREGGYNVLIDAMHSRAMTDGEPLLPLVELLLAHGASTQGESDWGESALSVSSHKGRFDVVERLLEAGADAQLLQWTDLMHAVALGSVAEVKRLLAQGADLAARDRWKRTPWLLSLQVGDLVKAKMLLASGANLNEVGNCGQTALMHAIENEHVDVLSWLIAQSVNLDGKDQFGGTALMKAAEQGATECVRQLLGAGAKVSITDATDTKAGEMKAFLEEINLEGENGINTEMFDFSDLPGEAAMAKAANLDIVRLLVAAGEDLGDISDEMRAELTGLETDGEIKCSHEEYLQGKHRRFGSANPERMNSEFWKAMVRSGATAYTARLTFDDTADFECEPVWSFHRFGKSITELPDGRIIEIGGEHEDSYDIDFCIYNEVFVHHGDGRFDILGYPEAVFPPTDFHSATLVGGFIYIIGCLGYPEARHSGETPVYRLNCETLAIEAVRTTGNKPGWINRHKAVYHASESGTGAIRVSGGGVWKAVRGKEEYLENVGVYVLDLSILNWSCIKED